MRNKNTFFKNKILRGGVTRFSILTNLFDVWLNRRQILIFASALRLINMLSWSKYMKKVRPHI